MKAMTVMVSVDWEGRELGPENLEAMNSFRDDFPHVPILQFLNAAYFTKYPKKQNEIKDKIQSVLRPHDELGLHIHSWKSLLEASGVKTKNYPRWVKESDQTLNMELDYGHDVPISSYTKEELKKIIRKSLEILSENGFNCTRCFRSGGWMGTPMVMDALHEEGFELDSSAVPPELLKDKRKSNILYEWLADVWPDSKITDGPNKIRETDSSVLFEFPNNGCLSDYMEGDDMLEIFKTNYSEGRPVKLSPDKEEKIYVSLGFHQETALKFLDRLRDGLKKIEKFSKEKGIKLTYEAYPFS